MKKIIIACFLTAALFISQNLFAQIDNKKENIAKALTDYFFLERENIHVHFDKNVFMTNEEIWFKGYVFHRKKNIPFFSTVNIYAILMDSDGKIINTQLIYGNIGSFSGNFKLGNTFKSGKYYLQFYTNWMNNFTEDESAIYEVSVINQSMGAGTALAKADPSKINIEFRPEGGTFVSGTTNSIGLHVSDCNHNPIPVSVVDITDASGKIIKKVQINKLGYGKFDLPPNSTQGYKAIVSIEDVKHEQSLPSAQLRGVSIEVNNYTIAEKTIVKIRTNKSTLDSFGGKPLYLLSHQDDKASVFEVNFNDNNLEQTLTIPNTELSDGMNSIRLIDSNMNELAERMIYKYPQSGLNSTITKTGQTSDQIQYKGKINYPNMNVSLSVLPENTISFEDTNDIYSSFLILPYLDNQKKASGKYYFNTLSKVKMYELDLFLINQKSKYQWFNILNNPPKNNYTFDMGLTLKGTIPPAAGNVKPGKIRLYSLTSGIDEMADIDDKREFYFNNMVMPDSTYVNFTLLRKGEKPKELTLMPHFLNVKRSFNKPYKPETRCYGTMTNDATLQNPNIYKENIQLEEVKIEGTTLKYASSFGNGNLRGYKISESTANMYQNLLAFIKTYGGFAIDEHDGNLKIYTRTVNSVNGAQAGPIIYLDNVQLLDNSMLSVIQMGEIDEIYMSSTAIVPSVRNFIGVIRIYLKKGVKPKTKNATPEIIIKDGFERAMPFQNVTYNSTEDKGFENFGIIDWEPSIMADENGEFMFSIPKMSLKPVKVLIEGFSADGKLISEIKILNTK